MRRNTGLSITETQVERILQGKSCSMPAEVVSLIEKQGRLYIEKILSAITEAGFDLRAVPSIFMGGGAAIFQHRVSTRTACAARFTSQTSMQTQPDMNGLWGR